MNYTIFMLAALGFLGILMHNLMKLNTINRANKGDLNFGKYLRIERFSIMLSFCVVFVCLIAQQEVKQLAQVGRWLGLGFVAIGYMAQSIIVKFAGKAKQFIDEDKILDNDK